MNIVEHAVSWIAAGIVGSAVVTAFLYLPWRVRDAYRQTFIALARAVESREPHLVGHAERTAHYAVMMSYFGAMPLWEMRNLERAALLHGIGKVGLPFGLLNNPDPLNGSPSSFTPADRFVVRDYVRIGAAILDAVPVLHPAANIVRCHHEYYDGSGYPFGRYGRGIPFQAQMLCVASEYVAMTTPRLYRSDSVMTAEQACAYIRQQIGVRYHWAAVALFLTSKSAEDILKAARSRIGELRANGLSSLPRRVF